MPSVIQRDRLVEQRGILGPSWRRRLAADSKLQLAGDLILRECSRYLSLRQEGTRSRARAEQDYPNVAAAFELNTNAKIPKLKMMVAADMPAAEIAQRLAIDVTVLEYWEKIFYDARDASDAISWFHASVIESERKSGNSELASRLKLAVCGGPIAIRAVLDADEKIPIDVADRAYSRRLMLDLKFDEALSMPLDNQGDSIRYVSILSKIRLEEDKLALQRDQLAQRCREKADEHERFKLRVEAERQRAAEKAAAEEQKLKYRAAERQAVLETKATIKELRQQQERNDPQVRAERLARYGAWNLKFGPEAAGDRKEARHSGRSATTQPPTRFDADLHEEHDEIEMPWSDSLDDACDAPSPELAYA